MPSHRIVIYMLMGFMFLLFSNKTQTSKQEVINSNVLIKEVR